MVAAIIIIVIVLVIFIIWGIISEHSANKTFEEYLNNKEHAKNKRRIEALNLEKQFNEKYSYLGPPSAQIFFSDKWDERVENDRETLYGSYCGVNYITVWEDQKLFLISSEYSSNFEGICSGVVTSSIDNAPQVPLSFAKLISCEVTDDVRITRGDAHSVTKTSKLGMLTRGAAGGALLGNVGALAGVMTAQTKTETTFDTDEITHNYKIHLTLNDFSCPSMSLVFGKSEWQMRQVLSVLNLIIKNS